MVPDLHLNKHIISLPHTDITGLDDNSVLNAAILKTEIQDRFERETNHLIDELEHVKYVCATADVWTNGNGTFLGSTLHWLEPISLQRKSAPFMRRQLKSTKYEEEIAEQLTSTSEKYRIKKKIVAVITNSGWNYGDAFKRLGVLAHETTGLYEFHEINFDSTLQKYNRCITVTHMLSQIATADAVSALANEMYEEIHTSVFEKLTRFWQKSFELSTELDEIVRPTEGRCNSLFDSLQFIINKGVDCINAMCTQLGVPTLTQRDHKFVLEFCQIMKPIVAAIDHLLKSNCYYAAFLPTIYTIDHALQKLLTKEFEYCRPLLQAIHRSFKSRFEHCFNLTDDRCKAAVLATCTHPFFKTRWLSPNHEMDKCIVEVVTNAMKEELQLQSNENDRLNSRKPDA